MTATTNEMWWKVSGNANISVCVCVFPLQIECVDVCRQSGGVRDTRCRRWGRSEEGGISARLIYRECCPWAAGLSEICF